MNLSDKELSLFFLSCCIFLALLAQYDISLITKIPFVMGTMVLALWHSRKAFNKKEVIVQ